MQEVSIRRETNNYEEGENSFLLYDDVIHEPYFHMVVENS